MTFKTISDNTYFGAEPAHGIELEATRLRRDRQDLVGELVVSCGTLGDRVIDGVLSSGRFNFSSPRERHEHAKRLRERARTNSKVDWLALLEEFARHVITADRTGRPAVLLHTLPLPTADEHYAVDGLVLLREHAVILFGDGGALKSYLALYLAARLVLQFGLRVLYCDWELAGTAHRMRLERLFHQQEKPHIHYVRCDQPLVFEADRITRLVKQHAIDLVICDSIGFATDGPPEAAEVATRYFQALRQIGVGSLQLAHTNRSEKNDEKPFGSSFWHNGARSTWHVKRADDSDVAEQATIGLFHRKSNLGPLLPAVGYEITFTDGETEFRRVSIAEHKSLSTALPLHQRIRQAVQHRPQTLVALQDELGAKIETIERLVRRHKTVFTRVPGNDGVHRVALLERPPS
jgi:AAA domain